MDGKIFTKLLNPDSIIFFVVGITFLLIGLHLMINNRIITKNLLQNVGIFQTKEIERDKKQVSESKLVSNRILVFIVGVIFSSVGFFLLFSILKKII